MTETWAIALFTGGLSVILLIGGGLIARILRTIDTNQQTLAANLVLQSEKLAELSKEFYTLRGEHYVNHDRRRAKTG